MQIRKIPVLVQQVIRFRPGEDAVPVLFVKTDGPGSPLPGADEDRFVRQLLKMAEQRVPIPPFRRAVRT